MPLSTVVHTVAMVATGTLMLVLAAFLLGLVLALQRIDQLAAAGTFRRPRPGRRRAGPVSSVPLFVGAMNL
ncbi:hypothetical protein Aab01nite_54010 [Paractinoplanes abujensis]|nr:hypothetical protein Aab01nite_54010 [Actinoplanes abujensis]